MPLKKGKSHEIISGNIKELVAAGHDPKQAVAMALSHSRKYSEGGMVDDEDGDMSTPSDLQTEGQFTNEVSNPEEIEEHNRFAKALKRQSEEMGPESYAMGGLVEGDSDKPLGNKPSENMDDSTEEPMSSMPNKPAAVEHAAVSISEEAHQALEDRKKKRRYAR